MLAVRGWKYYLAGHEMHTGPLHYCEVLNLFPDRYIRSSSENEETAKRVLLSLVSISSLRMRPSAPNPCRRRFQGLPSIYRMDILWILNMHKADCGIASRYLGSYSRFWTGLPNGNDLRSSTRISGSRDISAGDKHCLHCISLNSILALLKKFCQCEGASRVL